MTEHKVDRLLLNAKSVFTNGSFGRNLFVAIKGDCIIEVGQAQDWKSFVTKETQIIDCEGGTVLPGFVDAHCHPLAMALMHSYVDCKAQQINSLADLAEAIESLAGTGSWIRVANFPNGLLNAMAVDCLSLDRVTQTDPLLLIDDTGQTCVMNNEALRRTQINEGLSSSGASHYDLNLKGIFKGNDSRVSNLVPALSEAEIEAGIKALNSKLLAHGITTVHDTSWTNSIDTWHRYHAYKKAGILVPRVQMMAGAQLLDQFVLAGLVSGDGNDQLVLGAAKVAVDELLGIEQPDIGIIEYFIKQAIKHKFQLSLHAGSLYLIQAALQALDNVLPGTPPLSWPIRFEHCPVCPIHLRSSLGGVNRVLVIQPALFYSFSRTERELAESAVLDSWYPLKSLLDEGIAIAFSSDAPLGFLNPLAGIYAACSRDTLNAGIVNQSECLSLECAIELYTKMGASLFLRQASMGSIKAGMKADLVVIDQDFSSINLEQLLDSKVRLTMLDGNIVWQP